MQVKVKRNIKYKGRFYKKDDILKVNEYAVNRFAEYFELIEEVNPKEVKKSTKKSTKKKLAK